MTNIPKPDPALVEMSPEEFEALKAQVKKSLKDGLEFLDEQEDNFKRVFDEEDGSLPKGSSALIANLISIARRSLGRILADLDTKYPSTKNIVAQLKRFLGFVSREE